MTFYNSRENKVSCVYFTLPIERRLINLQQLKQQKVHLNNKRKTRMPTNTTSFLLDWDEAADHLYKYEKCPKQFDAREKAINKKIIRYLQQQVNKADRSSECIHFSCGSMRQSISLEAYNFIENATFSAMRGGTAFPIILNC